MKVILLLLTMATLACMAWAGGAGIDPDALKIGPVKTMPSVTPYRAPAGFGDNCPQDEGWCTCTARCTCIHDKQVAACEARAGDDRSDCLSQAQSSYGACWDDCYGRYGFLAANFSFC